MQEIKLPNLVGILNITPDSFSDGGSYVTIEAAFEQALRLAKAGAAIIDIGAQSTRPGAKQIGAQNEWKILEPVLKVCIGSLHEFNVKISVDTYHPEVAKLALSYGVDIINDVSGGEKNMLELIASSSASIIIMHNLGLPADPHNVMTSFDPIAEVKDWAEMRIAELVSYDIARERIIFDPGIGFGKSAAQSLALIKDIQAFKELGVQIMVGHSRKSFLSQVTAKPAAERDIETYVASIYLSNKQVDYLRVHDVEGNLRAIKAATLF
jgi:dihydropteroate synthase